MKKAFWKEHTSNDSFRANIDNQIRSWLNVSANISYSDNIGNTGIISGTGANRGGVVLSVINTPTYAPIWDPEKPNQYNKNFYGVNIMNPMENLPARKTTKQGKPPHRIRSRYHQLPAQPEVEIIRSPGPP